MDMTKLTLDERKELVNMKPSELRMALGGPPLLTAATKAWNEYNEHLERYCAAFAKETDLPASECELVRVNDPVERLFLRRRTTSQGASMIAAERERQVSEEGWTPEHDDNQCHGQMAIAGACYACPPDIEIQVWDVPSDCDGWPWDAKWDKRLKHGRLKQLAIAGALCAAEIDRLLRLEAVKNEEEANHEGREGHEGVRA